MVLAGAYAARMDNPNPNLIDRRTSKASRKWEASGVGEREEGGRGPGGGGGGPILGQDVGAVSSVLEQMWQAASPVPPQVPDDQGSQGTQGTQDTQGTLGG